jgi:hypothetical protein
VTLALTTSNPAAAVAPAVVTVPPGATAAGFLVTTFPVTAPAVAVISIAGFETAGSATLQVLPGASTFPPSNLLVNGSFETPEVPAGQEGQNLRDGQLPGWRISRGTVDVFHQRAWQPAPGQGNQGLDLVGMSPGTIEQTFPTVPGQEYIFSGWIAHNIDNPVAPEGRADVLLNGQFFVQLFHRDAQATRRDLRWVPFAYRFRATASTTTIALSEVSNLWSVGGLFLDGLAIVPAGPPFPQTPMGAPSGLSVRLIAPSQLELAWADNSIGETAFEIHRRTGAGDWIWMATIAANSTRFSDYNVLPSTSYSYRVRAVSDTGASAWSNEASATTLPGP